MGSASESKRNERSAAALWAVAALLMLTLMAAAVWKVWPTLRPQVAEVAALNPTCDLRSGPCSVKFVDGSSVEFAIEPMDIPVVKPLEYRVRLDGIDARKVEVDFQGVDMNMGYNRSALDARGEGVFIGVGMLPVCVREAMEWEAKVLLHTDRGVRAAPFRFITYTPGIGP